MPNGISGALPQIMFGCGIKYFSTQKIYCNYYAGEGFPYNLFWWEGIDGSKTLSYFHNDYNSQTNPASIFQRWNESHKLLKVNFPVNVENNSINLTLLKIEIENLTASVINK